VYADLVVPGGTCVPGDGVQQEGVGIVATGRVVVPGLIDTHAHTRAGVLRPGEAADIAVLDLRREWAIDRRRLCSKRTIGPCDGRTVRGKPAQTIVNGKVVDEDGEVLGHPGDGRFVRASH